MKVLAIGAHPDDIELICAGTMAKFKNQGAEIFLCHVCDGNKGSKVYKSDELAKIRRNEAITLLSFPIIFLILIKYF